jgi:RNA polymerase sigma-70 factor, ECF subfamily
VNIDTINREEPILARSDLGRPDVADPTLVDRLAARDPAALAEIYDTYGRSVFALALRILGDPAGAEDVVHDVFLKLWRDPAQYRIQRGSLRSWLLSVSHNRCIDILRHRRVAASHLVSAEQDWKRVAHEVTAGGTGDLGDQAALAEEAARVRWALAQIPRPQRQVIEMAFFEGKTHDEISTELGEPLGTAKTRIRLGMRKLRTLLHDSGTATRSA